MRVVNRQRDGPTVLDGESYSHRRRSTRREAVVFDAVHPSIAKQLEALVASLPALECLHDDEATAMGTVLTEIINE